MIIIMIQCPTCMNVDPLLRNILTRAGTRRVYVLSPAVPIKTSSFLIFPHDVASLQSIPIGKMLVQSSPSKPTLQL